MHFKRVKMLKTDKIIVFEQLKVLRKFGELNAAILLQ